IWTLTVFAISLFILVKAVFPRIGQALDQRRKTIDESIDAAERTRLEADQVLAEYRERLRAARQEADEIIERTRQSVAAAEREARTEAQARREQMMEQTRRDIEAETRRVLDEIVRDVVDLTVMTTELVTRKVLTAEDQRRLVEDAVSELDFSVLSGGLGRQS
ncbi:MAG TPA: F0F1 ATP synthase subunit B, partial [Acidimicrobiales bacterium]|nr:F0F1 ATP synthase subunit B [Acidimicrobiales bacterium]